MDTGRKIPLPNFLKLLTNNNVPTPKAMAIAGKIYKEFNTPSSLSQLTDVKLAGAGIDDKDLRKSALAAFRKAGYKPALRKVSDSKKPPQQDPSQSVTSTEPQAGPSTPSVIQILTTPTKKKRKRDDDINEFLPDGPTDEAAKYGNMEFNEILDEELLKTKWTIVNRAPLMTAWATVVAERMGFEREEALSIASVYTEMNAISKGITLGIYEASKNRGMEATKSGSQPYVDIMGRSALYETQAGHWRALANNNPAKPSTAFSYISRSLRQTTPHVIGALRLLANSYNPQQLNKDGFSLYAEFRPTVEEWGGRGELRCDKILALRRKIGKQEAGSDQEVAFGESEATSQTFVKVENVEGAASSSREIEGKEDEPNTKRTRGLSLEEYEAALDQDMSLYDVDLDFNKEVPGD